MSVKQNVFNNRENNIEKINRFRNGDKTQHLTSVDIEEIVKSGGYVVDLLEKFIFDNLEGNPVDRLVIAMEKKKQI